MPDAKHKLVIFSPLPPLKNGIADYTGETLHYLKNYFEITVVIDNHTELPGSQRFPDIKVIKLVKYLSHQYLFSDIVHLYHLGNNPDHIYMLPIIIKQPGIIVLHDYSLHYLIDTATLRNDQFDAYAQALTTEYGYAGKVLADQFIELGWRERTMFYELPMNRMLLKHAKSIIVHSEYSRFKVLAQCTQNQLVTTIPHHLTPVVAEQKTLLSREKARDLLGIKSDELLVISLGFVTKTKLLDVILRTLARNRADLVKVKYIVVGEKQPDQYDVDAEITRLGLNQTVEITGYVVEKDFFKYVLAADIVVNLRYPTGGETSGTLIRALGTGACTMVVDYGPFSEYPDDVVVKIPWNNHFEQSFEDLFLKLASSPSMRDQYRQRSQEYMVDSHAIEKSAAKYANVINETIEQSRQVNISINRKPAEYITDASLFRLSENVVYINDKGWLWLREGAFPSAPSADQVLIIEVKKTIQPVLTKYFDYKVSQVTQKTLEDLSTNQYVDYFEAGLIVMELIDQAEIYDLLIKINSAIKLNSVCTLNIYQTENQQVSPAWSAIKNLIEMTGFEIQVEHQGSFNHEKLQGRILEEYCWHLLKVSDYIVPVPEKNLEKLINHQLKQ